MSNFSPSPLPRTNTRRRGAAAVLQIDLHCICGVRFLSNFSPSPLPRTNTMGGGGGAVLQIDLHCNNGVGVLFFRAERHKLFTIWGKIVYCPEREIFVQGRFAANRQSVFGGLRARRASVSQIIYNMAKKNLLRERNLRARPLCCK